ncbi:uncharacterized protein TNCV_281871 [Trichonephila clavipes]|nr:uncharacterized protein TNCV_281871 [Trichonephila clavipes]
MASKSHFSTRHCLASHGKGVTRLLPHCYYPSLACPIPRFVSNRAYLGSFGMSSWASHESERTGGKVIANMGRNVSRHTELVCLNARSHSIDHSQLGNDGRRPGSGRKGAVNTSKNHKRVQRNPRVSMRQIARDMGISDRSVHNSQNDRIWCVEAPSTSAIVEHRQYPKSVMVWGGICASGKTLLVFVEEGVIKSIKKCTGETLLKLLYFRETKSISEIQIGRFNKTLHQFQNQKGTRVV